MSAEPGSKRRLSGSRPAIRMTSATGTNITANITKSTIGLTNAFRVQRHAEPEPEPVRPREQARDGERDGDERGGRDDERSREHRSARVPSPPGEAREDRREQQPEAALGG